MKTFKHYSTKTFGNEIGLSCCFRQWRATHSHCSLLHGYSVGFKIIFGADELDERNWVWDFGGCKPIKAFLEEMFDHKTAVASDDPLLEHYKELEKAGGCELTIVPNGVGCERFAELVYNYINTHMISTQNRVHLVSVECFEHGANSAIYYGE